MSNRLVYSFLSVTTLVLGGGLYLFFREDTYISVLFKEVAVLTKLREVLKFAENNFIKYYFPDFLWAFSICFGLLFIFNPKNIGKIVCCSVSFGYGVAWELMQFFGVVKGTGDGFDILMYFAACFIVLLFCKKRRN